MKIIIFDFSVYKKTEETVFLFDEETGKKESKKYEINPDFKQGDMLVIKTCEQSVIPTTHFLTGLLNKTAKSLHHVRRNYPDVNLSELINIVNVEPISVSSKTSTAATIKRMLKLN